MKITSWTMITKETQYWKHYFFVDVRNNPPEKEYAKYRMSQEKGVGGIHVSWVGYAPNGLKEGYSSPQEVLNFLNNLENLVDEIQWVARFFKFNDEQCWGIFNKEVVDGRAEPMLHLAHFAVKLDPSKNTCKVIKNRQTGQIDHELPFNPEKFLDNFVNFENTGDLVASRNQIVELINTLSKMDREEGGYLEYAISSLKQARTDIESHLNEMY